MIIILYCSCASLVETMNHLKSLKLKCRPGDTVEDWCSTILVGAERLESLVDFNTNHLVYITHIFENSFDPIFNLWETRKYKEVMCFINKLRVYDKGIMQPEDIITYGVLLKSLWVNTATLFTQRGGNPLISRESLRMSLCLWRLLLRHLNSKSSILWIELVSRASTVSNTLTLVESCLPSQLQIITSVAKRVICKGI